MAFLKLADVSKSFGALTVADKVSFEVPQGEALGIVGPNGAGKSTLFNLITGNLRPDEGKITFKDKDITKMPANRRIHAGIGRSFQVPQPFGSLTVFENLLAAASFGRNASEQDVAQDCLEILETTELMAVVNTPTAGLPLLNRKRLEMARALATQPDLLLLDEIAGGLTDGECVALTDTIRSVNAQGVTIIWIEHVLYALTAVVQRLLVLDFGKVIAQGNPTEVMGRDAVREIYLGADS